MPRASATWAERDVAQAEVADQALALQLGQRGERRLDRSLARPVDSPHDAQVDDVERVEAEVAQVVVHRAASSAGAMRRDPRGVRAAHRADLGDDDQIVRIGVQRLADELVGDVRAVEVAGVDVVDAARDRLAQHGERGVAILAAARTRRARRAAWRRSPCGFTVRSPRRKRRRRSMSVMIGLLCCDRPQYGGIGFAR